MIPSWLIIGGSLTYLLVVLAVAEFGGRRADEARTIIANAWNYGLSPEA